MSMFEAEREEGIPIGTRDSKVLSRRILSACSISFAVFSSLISVAILLWAVFPLSSVSNLGGGSITPVKGNAYYSAVVPRLPLARIVPDSISEPQRSTLLLRENEQSIGPPHSLHASIETVGNGRYSHWGNGLVFSTSDNSDPRANGRKYDVVAEERPVWWLAAGAAALLFGSSLLLGIRLVLSHPRKWGRFGAAMLKAGSNMLVAGSVVIAGLATVSRFDVFSSRSELEPTSFVPIIRAMHWREIVTAGREQTTFHAAISRRPAPFLIIPARHTEAAHSPLELSLNGHLLPAVQSVAELAAATQTVFLDDDSYVLVGFPKDALPGLRQGDVITLIYPVRVTLGGVILSWLVALLALYARHVLHAPRSLPVWRRLSRLVGVPSGCIGMLLVGLNVAGLVGSLRSPHLGNPDFHGGAYGPNDLTLDAETALHQLQRQVGESSLAYVRRATSVVSQSMMHFWWYSGAKQLHMHVPASENAILWLLGEVRDQEWRYHYVDYRKAIERGIGMCGQVSQALTGVLRDANIDARVVQLDGHTVVTAEVAPGNWFVLDADFGVVAPYSLPEIEQRTALMVPLYTRAIEALDPSFGQSAQVFAEEIAKMYDPAGNFIEPKGANMMMGEEYAAREKFAYELKWAIPVGLLLVFCTWAALEWLAGSHMRTPPGARARSVSMASVR
jgi:hypothetical protein